MSLKLGNLCQLAGAAVGTYFCPGAGTAIGSAAGKMVGDIVDGKKSENTQVTQNNTLGLGNLLSGTQNTDALNGIDLTKLVSIFSAL